MTEKFRKREQTTRRELPDISHEVAAFKDPRQLPALPVEITKNLISQIRRGSEEDRTQIHMETEQTVPETEKGIFGESSGPELGVGVVIIKEWKVRDGDSRTVIEQLEIEEKLSGKHNIAGDVWRAKRYWDGVYYGDVVLKTPKKKLRESRSSFELARVYRDMNEEKNNLEKFDHPNIVSSSGKQFLYNLEPVIQMEYQPWSFLDYLMYQKSEHDLTGASMSAAIQTLDAINYLANIRDAEAPNGYVHVDLKRDHMRLDYRKDERGNMGWFVKVIDLDSIITTGSLRLVGTKYNPCVDPEKFMKLHDPRILITAEPSETVYAMGITLITALAYRMRIRTEKRGFKLEGIDEERGKVFLTDEEKLRGIIIQTRVIDEVNLLKVYYANKFRRVLAGKFDQDPDGMRELIERYHDMPEIRKEALEQVRDSDANATVHPSIFAGIRECIKQYSERYDVESILAVFEGLWNEYLRSEENSEKQ